MSTDATQVNERFGGDPRITPAMEDYLKAIYRIEQEGEPATTHRLAEEMDLSGASVSNMVKRLNDLNLLVHSPYRGVVLTPSGSAVALEVIRHHRLLELYLSQALGFEIDQVHEEADRLEHHVSEELETRMEQALGFPEYDPHGHPIPSRNGAVPAIADMLLGDLPSGQTAVVSRISDRDPEHLRQIDHLGIGPGTPITAIGDEGDVRLVSVNGVKQALSGEITALIHVRPDGALATS
ncbi:MAG TPA: metal-dependent transcriptional regulator [Thermomicrobiales bacterium]|nr:metal-dependent transcriptional regulator [Thermomicrobiales bacterium]